jgi:hypothetical protein
MPARREEEEEEAVAFSWASWLDKYQSMLPMLMTMPGTSHPAGV